MWSTRGLGGWGGQADGVRPRVCQIPQFVSGFALFFGWFRGLVGNWDHVQGIFWAWAWLWSAALVGACRLLDPHCWFPHPCTLFSHPGPSSSSWRGSCRLLGRFAGVKKRAHLLSLFVFFSCGERMEKGKRGIHLSTKRDHKGKDDPRVRKGIAPFSRRKYTAIFMEKCVKIHIACSFKLLAHSFWEFHQFHSDITRKLHRRRSLHRVRSVRNASSYNQHL